MTPSRSVDLVNPTGAQVDVCRAFAALGRIVPISQWCVVGGMMTEFVLLDRGRTTLRPTTDGDIVGNVIANRRVLRSLTQALQTLGFQPRLTGWEGEFGTRFQHPSTGTFIDLLAPENSARRRDISTVKGRKTLEAPGTDFALVTAQPMTIRFDSEDAPLVASVPTIAGAIYAKISAFEQISELDNRVKHLQDAAQMLVAARPEDFTESNKAMLKRLRWLSDALDRDERAWQGSDRTDRLDAQTRLRRLLQPE
jgi:hypothetical protein